VDTESARARARERERERERGQGRARSVRGSGASRQAVRCGGTPWRRESGDVSGVGAPAANSARPAEIKLLTNWFAGSSVTTRFLLAIDAREAHKDFPMHEFFPGVAGHLLRFIYERL
jgi:hypothetical protein